MKRRNSHGYRKGFSGKRRSTKADYRRIIIVACAFVLAFCIGYLIYSHLPVVKLNKAIAAGDKSVQNADYEAAINSYLEAIEISKDSVKAYSNLAGAYLSIDDSSSAKEALLSGYENTGSEALLHNYHSVILNEAVASINSDTASMDTIKSVVSVLSEDAGNEDALNILNSAYLRVFDSAYAYDTNALFRASYVAEDAKGETFSYTEYEALVRKLMDIYEANPTDALKDVVLLYVTPAISSFTLNTEDVDSYIGLIDEVASKVGTSDEIASFKECLDNSVEVQAIFADIFTQLDVGNVDELRDFVVSDEYLAIRDIFLKGEYSPQENTTYVPVSREAIILNYTDDKWSYRFLDFSENPTTAGVITIWANFFEDGGIQRNAISYEPAAIDGNLYPHTEYTVTYLNSYITSGSSTKVIRMNYRLDTTVTSENGEINEIIVSDWGGPDELTMDIDKIESRIKA